MKKTSQTKIAAVYGLAIYQAATDQKKTYQEVGVLLDSLAKNAEFCSFLANPLISSDKKDEIIKGLKLSSTLTNSLLVISANNRAVDILAILKEYIKIYHKENNIIDVEVLSTYQLPAAQLKKIENKIKQRLQKDVLITNNISPEILGGLIVKYNSQMLDASILGKLNSIEKLMKGSTNELKG